MITVSAENQRSDDVVVSLVRNGRRERLGPVIAQGSEVALTVTPLIRQTVVSPY
jgi:hypothetical protein